MSLLHGFSRSGANETAGDVRIMPRPQERGDLLLPGGMIRCLLGKGSDTALASEGLGGREPVPIRFFPRELPFGFSNACSAQAFFHPPCAIAPAPKRAGACRGISRIVHIAQFREAVGQRFDVRQGAILRPASFPQFSSQIGEQLRARGRITASIMQRQLLQRLAVQGSGRLSGIVSSHAP